MAIRDMADGRRVTGEESGRVLLDLLDGFRLRVGSEHIEISEVAQRLVAFIALNRRPLPRALVAGTLWPEKTESRAFANLRSSLWRLHCASPPPTIICSGSSLLLNPAVRLDVAVLERHGWALLDGSLRPTTELRADWFSMELLPGWYEDWVIVERERLSQLQIRFLEALVHHLRGLGEYARAIDQAMRLVATDPLRERSQLALIHALVDEGSWGRAHRQADDYCRLLDDAFGCRASTAFVSEYHTLFPFDRALTR
jgi:DNA-binding SARP family transcriptional activator